MTTFPFLLALLALVSLAFRRPRDPLGARAMRRRYRGQRADLRRERIELPVEPNRWMR